MNHTPETTGAPGKNQTLPGVLYLVATPIGNLSDISERALKVLGEVDFIAAEDTRRAMKLLSCYELPKKELLSYFEHNKRGRGAVICDRLAAGESCALVTDAGTPAISDPGEDLVALCAERGVPVVAVPGCCAAVTALALSGLPSGRFVFEGFLPVPNAERRRRLAELSSERRTLVLYEAPHKLKGTLSDLGEALGERRLTLCRELTKLHEQVWYTTLREAAGHYESHTPKGEFVLVIEGASASTGQEGGGFLAETGLYALPPAEHVGHYMARGMKRMDAIKAAAADRGMSKSELYSLLQQKE